MFKSLFSIPDKEELLRAVLARLAKEFRVGVNLYKTTEKNGHTYFWLFLGICTIPGLEDRDEWHYQFALPAPAIYPDEPVVFLSVSRECTVRRIHYCVPDFLEDVRDEDWHIAVYWDLYKTFREKNPAYTDMMIHFQEMSMGNPSRRSLL